MDVLLPRADRADDGEVETDRGREPGVERRDVGPRQEELEAEPPVLRRRRGLRRGRERDEDAVGAAVPGDAAGPLHRGAVDGRDCDDRELRARRAVGAREREDEVKAVAVLEGAVAEGERLAGRLDVEPEEAGSVREAEHRLRRRVLRGAPLWRREGARGERGEALVEEAVDARRLGEERDRGGEGRRHLRRRPPSGRGGEKDEGGEGATHQAGGSQSSGTRPRSALRWARKRRRSPFFPAESISRRRRSSNGSRSAVPCTST